MSAQRAPRGPWLAAAGLGLSALVWGLSWWPVRHAQALGVQPLWTTALIEIPGTVLLLMLRPGTLLEVLRSPGLALVALGSGGANVCFNLGVAAGDVVRVVLLFYLMPVWATLLARAVLRERIGVAGWLRLALALGGALLVLWPRDGGWPVPHHAADWLGLCGGMFFALNNVMLRRCAGASAAAGMLAMFTGALLCSALLGGLLLQLGAIAVPPAPRVAWLLPVGLLGCALVAGGFGLQYGAARLSAGLTALVMMLEIVFASLSSALLGASHPGLHAAAGGALIAAGVLFGAMAEARARAAAPDETYDPRSHGAAQAPPRRPT